MKKINTHTQLYIYIHIKNMYIYIYKHVYIYIYIYICTYHAFRNLEPKKKKPLPAAPSDALRTRSRGARGAPTLR